MPKPSRETKSSGANGDREIFNPSHETKFSGTYGDRGIFIFPIQLTTSRIGNLTRLIHTLLYVVNMYVCISCAVSRYGLEL